MNIFILEDNKHRQEYFAEKYKDHNLHIYDNALDAIKFFMGSNIQWHLLSLDHDLGGRIFVNPTDENTGSFFVKMCYYKIKSTKTLKKIIIHSWNPFGAKVMIGLLHDINIPIYKKRCRIAG